MALAVLRPLIALAWSGLARAGVDAPTSPALEGAVGMVVRDEPGGAGTSSGRFRLVPGGFIRWRRLTLSAGGGFATRSRDDVEGGVVADLGRADGVRFRLGLSADRGIDASFGPTGTAWGEIRPTLRGRISASWKPDAAWHLALRTGADLLGRGGGVLSEGSMSRRWALGPRDHVSATVFLNWANADHTAQRFGVDAAQSVASGLPAFQPGAGWQRLRIQGTWRGDFELEGQPFTAFVSLSQGWIVGDAAHSPRVAQRHSAAWSAGLARRF